MSDPRIVEVRRKVLKENDVIARSLRQRFQHAGVRVISLVSSPGSGKTALLERLLSELRQQCRVAALVGDLATENDAQRLACTGVPVKQITTGTLCHLDAGMVERALSDWQLGNLDLLFIENVGNLVCPSSFDLGEHLRLVLTSTTEGEDKPLKYPTIFNTADVAVVTKLDLAEAVGFDHAALVRNIHSVRPNMMIVEVSARTGLGIHELKSLLLAAQTTVPGQEVVAATSNCPRAPTLPLSRLAQRRTDLAGRFLRPGDQHELTGGSERSLLGLIDIVPLDGDLFRGERVCRISIHMCHFGFRTTLSVSDVIANDWGFPTLVCHLSSSPINSKGSIFRLFWGGTRKSHFDEINRISLANQFQD